MSWNDTPARTPEDHDGDPLEGILGDAVWPEIEPERIDRLRQRWARVTERPERRAWWLSAAALVGLVAASVTVRQLVTSRTDRQSPPSALSQKGERNPVGQDQQPLPAAGATAMDATVTASPDRGGRSHRQQARREGPSALEQLIVASVRRRVAQRGARRPAASNDLLQQAMEQVLRNPQADLTGVCQPLLDQRERFEQQLNRIIRQSSGAQQLTAVRLLAQIATSRSLPLLTQLYRGPLAHREVTLALAQLTNPLSLARLVQIEPQPALRRQLLAALLRRGDSQSVQLFLQFVEQPATSKTALRAVAEVREPPVDVLLAYLQSPRVRLRMAAARALGQLNDPAVSRRLIQLALTGSSPSAALVALAASHEPLAMQFVASAQRDLSLVASVRAARYRAASFPN